MRLTHLLIALPAVLLGGCATHAVDKGYGSAYAQMVREQTYDVSTLATGQGNRVIEGTDPDVANAAVQAMRGDTANRAALRTGPVTNITQQSGGGSQ